MKAILELRRRTTGRGCTLGDLYLNGKFFCYTLEDPVRPAGVVVPGDTAIAAGRYPVTLTMSPRLKILTPRLGGRLAGRGVLLHAGTGPKDTLGCILVALGIKPTNDALFRSVDAFQALMHALLKFTTIELIIS